LVATLFSFISATGAVIGSTIAGCVVLVVIMFLSDDKRKPSLILFSRHVAVFVAPLLIVFAYLVLIWGSKILTS
jgi:hypothetical protein